MLTTHLTLLERLRSSGDESAWVRFVDLYTPLLHRWASRQQLQPNDADDVIQDLMLLLHRKLPEFRYDPAQSFRAWLRTVFLNKCREIARRRQLPTSTGGIDQLPLPASDADDVEDRRILLHRGLELIKGEFSPTSWQAFWEYAIRERPVPEVARELGIAPGSVYTARSRVLARLRLELDRLLD